VSRTVLAPNLAYMFQVLRLAATVIGKDDWRVVHAEDNLIHFEIEHGRDAERYRYNERCLARVRREGRAVLGQHAGLSDLFVPIVVGGTLTAVLVAGPFLTSRPSAADVMSRWRRLTGRQGHPEDPEFAYYLSMTLSTLVLEGTGPELLERFATSVARVMGGDPEARALLIEAESLHRELEHARFVDQVWDAARKMIDARTSRFWSGPHQATQLAALGLSRPADEVLVGLTVGRRPSDPVDDLLRCDAFQRACVELARNAGELMAGQVGSHGVVFLSCARGRRRRLSDLGERVAAIAGRRFAFRLHLGLSHLPSTASLPDHYEAALAAAESALSQGVRIANTFATFPTSAAVLRKLQRELGELVEQKPDTLPARFDRYLEAVARRCGYRLEPARAHLEAGLFRMADALIEAGALEEKSFDDTHAELDRAARQARTVNDLFAAYRHVVAELALAVERPSSARQERRIGRAVAYIHRHYGEPISLARVARIAGFAPGYFSRRFKRREHMTFERYLCRLRIERAKQLLTGTDLTVGRVAQLSGFSSQQYFARVFKRTVGTTPLSCRKRLRAEVRKGQREST
jgi:AraC-like DNA-binding protein